MQGVADEKKEAVIDVLKTMVTRISAGMTAVKQKLMGLPFFKEAKKVERYAVDIVSIDFESVKKALGGLNALNLEELSIGVSDTRDQGSTGGASNQAIV